MTTTVVAQVADAPAASRAAHDTGVAPTGKNDPEGGEQIVVTGGTPPVTMGWNVTRTGASRKVAAVGTGHMMASGLLNGATPETSFEGALRLPLPSYACTTK